MKCVITGMATVEALSFCAAVCIWFHLYAFFLFFVMTPNLAAGFSEFDM